jgi:4'-phosphopantetheinyl transferase
VNLVPNSPDAPSPRAAREPWLPQSGRVELRPGEVHVWRVDLRQTTDDVRATLSDAERARAERFRSTADRTRFIASHAALRAILGDCLDVAPSALAFGETVHGKPFVAAPEAGRAARFSLSHSGDIALVAVAVGREIGVDVERVRPVADLDGFAARYFSRTECAALGRVPPAERLRAHLGVWTLKEAYLKACGEGLTRELDAFDVTVGDAQPRLAAVRDRPGDELRWTFARLELGHNAVGALAAQDADWSLRRWRR